MRRKRTQGVRQLAQGLLARSEKTTGWIEAEAAFDEGVEMIRLAISADGHINEPGDLWNKNLPASMVAEGPRVEVRNGKIAMVVEGRVIRRLAEAPTTSSRRDCRHEPWNTYMPFSVVH